MVPVSRGAIFLCVIQILLAAFFLSVLFLLSERVWKLRALQILPKGFHKNCSVCLGCVISLITAATLFPMKSKYSVSGFLFRHGRASDVTDTDKCLFFSKSSNTVTFVSVGLKCDRRGILTH